MTGAAYFGRLEAARILALGGVVLAACGMVLGEIYAIYISHVANGLIKLNWAGVIEAAANGNVSIVTDHFAVIGDLTEKRGRMMNTHSHLAAFGFLALVLAYLQPYVGLTAATRRRLAGVYLGGAVLQFVCVYLSYYTGKWMLYIADLGAALVIIAVAGTLLGLRSPPAEAPAADQHLVEQLGDASSRYLVKSGLLLILAGMVFGLYYAWQLVSHDEPAVYEAVDAAVTGLAAQNSDLAGEEITRFKGMQSKIAITAAAHSHAIEFGFLMLLLAFVQRYVLLDDVWRLRWARLLSVGAFLLPVCVYLATRYGLRAAAFADFFGGLVLLGLLAMGFGLIRHTGAADAAARGASV